MYDYSRRKGVHPISWNVFHGLCKALTLAIAPFAPDLILPIGRGGFYPGTLLAHMLQVDLFPIRLSRRDAHVVRYDTPRWIVEPPVTVAGARVLLVDDISGSGETLTLAAEKTRSLGAAVVRSAVLYAHSGGVEAPDYIGMVTDALLLNPWDREIVDNGAFRMHPEYVDALAQQEMEPSPELLIDAGPAILAKAGQDDAWLSVAHPKLPLTLRYPNPTPLGFRVAVAEPPSAAGYRVHLTSEGSREIYFEVGHYPGLHLKNAIAVFQEENLRRRADLVIGEMEEMALFSRSGLRFSLQWPGTRRQVIFLGDGDGVLRIIYDPESTLTERILASAIWKET